MCVGRDEKYRQVVKDTPALLSQIVDVLSIAGNPEAKKIVLRMISSFGSVSENKMMVGHQGGFQKMLTLLVDGDEDLSREVLKTLKHFLNVEICQVADGIDEAQLGVVGGGFALFSSQKIVNAMAGVTQIAVSEVNRMFPAAKLEEKMQMLAANMVDVATDEATLLRESMAFLLAGGEAGLFPPAQASLQQVFDSLSQSAAHAAQSGEPGGGSDEATPLPGGTEDEVVKELMRMQGVLSTLTMSISEAARTVQLDMMETISRLLLNNPRNQHEFRTADGYTRFLQLIDRVTDYSAKENRVFLQDVFDTVFTIAMDGNPERVVGNPDAMRLLVDLACTAASSEVRVHAVRTLHDLLTVNYTNAAVLQSVSGDTVFIELLLDGRESADGSQHIGAELVEALVKLLEYMIFLLSPHNLRPLGHALRSLAASYAAAVPLAAWTEDAILNMVANIICDLRARKAPVNVSTLLPSVIDMVRRSVADSGPGGADAAGEAAMPQDTRVLRLLEILGVLVHDSPTLVQLIEESHGLTLLTDIVCHDASELAGPNADGKETSLAVRHTALWVLQDVVAASSRGGTDLTGWLVSLLGAQLPFELHKLVFAAVREAGISSVVKRCLRASGALDALVEILRQDNLSLVEPALKTLEVLIRDCEENKSYVTEELLHGDYTLLVQSFGSIPVTLRNFRIAFELTCIGPVHAVLGPAATSEPEDRAVDSEPPRAGGDADTGSTGVPLAESAAGERYEPRQAAADSDVVLPPDSDEPTPVGEGGLEEGGAEEDTQLGGGPWRNAIRGHIQRIQDPHFLFPHGPPSLSRHYAFLIALQTQREQTSDDDDNGSLSPRSQMTSELRDTDVLSQMSDSASESSSIRDSIDLAARDLALQALLNEQAAGAKGKVDGRQPRWWELGRRRERVDEVEPEPEPEPDSAVPKGVKVQVDRFADDVTPAQAGGKLGRQIITSMLKFDPHVTDPAGVPFWRPGSGWAVSSAKPSLMHGGTKLTPKAMIRGSTALSLLLEIILLADEQTQGAMLASVLRVAASGLAARRSLCHAGGLQRCLRLSLDPRLSNSESVQRLVHVLASAVGRYDVSLPEVRELFLMAYSVQSSRQQIRLLQVIAAVAQRWEPVALMQLSGPVSAVTAPALDKFPKQQTGYTICAWVKLRATLEPGENLLFCWKDPKYLVFELFFRVWPREQEDGTIDPTPRRNLCVRMRNSPCTHTEYFTYDEFSFDSVDSWHHLVLTHNKQLLSLYVDGRYVQSFQPLNYPIGVSKAYRLHAIVGCPQDTEANTHTAFLEQCTGTFCGELGFLHVTEGVWDATSAEAAAKSFPYQRNLQAIGVTHKQLLCIDPLSCPSLPFTNDERGLGETIADIGSVGNAAATAGQAGSGPQGDDGDRAVAAAPAPEDSAVESDTVRLMDLERWRELQREQTREKEREIERWRDDRPIVLSDDVAHDPYAADDVSTPAASASPAPAPPRPSPKEEQPTEQEPHPSHSIALPSLHQSGGSRDYETAPRLSPSAHAPSLGFTRHTSDADPSADGSAVEEMLEAAQKAVSPLGVQGDVDVHHMGSLHEVAHEMGDFYLPLPFLVLQPAQRALGLRVLLEMLYASEKTLKAFRDARAGSTVLYLLQGWSSNDGHSDPAFEALFEMLREQTLPVGECMRLIIDLMLIDNHPMQKNLEHLQTLSDMLMGASGHGELERERLHHGSFMAHQWKERGGGMIAMMEVLSRSSEDLMRVALDIVKQMWEPSFTTEDLEMMLEFCVGTVEEMLSILEESDTDEEQDEDDPEEPGSFDGELGDGGAGRNVLPHGVRGSVPPAVDQVPIEATGHLASDVDGDAVEAPDVGSDDASDVQLQVDAPGDFGETSEAGLRDSEPDEGGQGIPRRGLYEYGYDSGDELEDDSAEIDATVAHGLGIADCDFHDWPGDADAPGDGWGKPTPEPTEVDYAAQISEAKVEALVFLRELLVAKSPEMAVELLRGAGGFQVLFALLSSPDERIRLLALDLLGLMVTHGKPADAKAFALAGGFDTVGKYLVRHWISRPVGWALLCLAVRTASTTVDTAEWLEGRARLSGSTSPRGPATPTPSFGRSASDRSEDEASPLVVNFEALYCLLNLLQFGTTDKPVEREMAERVAEIVTGPHNLDQLLAHNFGEWSFAFFAKMQRHAVTRRGGRHRSHVFQAVRRINSAMLLLHIPRALPPKTFKQLRKSISDAADFGIYLVEDILAHYEQSPVLTADDAGNTVKNLASIFDQIEEHTDIPVETCVSIVALINNMAVRNNSTSRNHMMTNKLLDTRGETCAALPPTRKTTCHPDRVHCTQITWCCTA